jgi:hypothetical protein
MILPLTPYPDGTRCQEQILVSTPEWIGRHQVRRRIRCWKRIGHKGKWHAALVKSGEVFPLSTPYLFKWLRG